MRKEKANWENGFGSSIRFAKLAMVAARDASPESLKPILVFLCEELNVDRIAIAAFKNNALFFITGIGVDLPNQNEEIEDVDSDVLQQLKTLGAVSKPTENIGWDYYLAIYGGKDHEIKGCLLIDDTTTARELNPSHDFHLRQCADLLSWIIGYDTEFRGLQDLAITDGLTGLYSRRHIMERLNEIHILSIRQKTSFWLIMLDIDHFKIVNDTHGHVVGDQVLRDLANMLRQTIRGGEIIGRFGGEEFIIFGSGNLKNGLFVAERIRQKTENNSAAWKSGVSITVSQGVGVIRLMETESLEALLKRADQELYKAKRAGRNKIYPEKP